MSILAKFTKSLLAKGTALVAVLLFLGFFFASPSYAVTCSGGSCSGLTPGSTCALGGGESGFCQQGNGGGGGSVSCTCVAGVFGTIQKPVGVERFGGAGEIGLLAFLSLLIRIFTVIAGLIVFFNFITSGYTYLTAEGNPKAHEQVRNRLTYSVIGIVLIVSAYTITALLSLIFFGSATFILNPEITPPGATGTP